jgi:hypothetical protein
VGVIEQVGKYSVSYISPNLIIRKTPLIFLFFFFLVDSNLCAYIRLVIHLLQNMPKGLCLTSTHYKILSLFTILFLSYIETHFIKINNNIMVIERL